jgi:CheY-like chemotaxis protein
VVGAGNTEGSATMSDNWSASRGGFGATLSRPDPARRKAPRLILGGRAFAARLAGHLRDLGWDVQTAADGTEARKLALRNRPHAVLLLAETDGESGYLTCAKLRQCLPRMRVVLVGSVRTAEAERFAGFVGAAFAAEATVVDELHRLVRAWAGSEN